MHLQGVFAGEFGFVLRLHRHLAEFRREAGLLQRILDRRKIVRGGNHLDRAVLVGQHVLCAGFDRRVHQFGLVRAGREQHLATMLEQETHAAVGAHVATVLGEGMANLGDGAHLVVGQAIHHHGRAIDAVALVTNFFVAHTVKLAGTALDRVVDVVLRQALRLGLVYCQSQARIGPHIAAAHLGGHGDFLDQFGEDLAALGILPALAMLDIGPFGVSGHVVSLVPCCGLEFGNSSIWAPVAIHCHVQILADRQEWRA